MPLLIGTMIFIALCFLFAILGKVFKNTKLFIVSGVILAFVIIFWLVFVLWALVEDDKEFERKNPENSISNVTENEIIENTEISKNIVDSDENSIEDLTISVENETRFRSGNIISIDNDDIYFESNDNQKYKIQIKPNFKLINGRTSEDIDISEVKEGDHIATSFDYEIFIYRNIKDEELRNELLINLSLSYLDNNVHVGPAGIDIKEINKISDKEAIVTMGVYDLESFDDDPQPKEAFEAKFKFDSNTVIKSKGNNINSIDTLEEAKYNINDLRLDPTTIQDKIPLVVEFYSSDS